MIPLEYIEILDQQFGDLYCIKNDTELYLRFPELDVYNSVGESTKIREMIVHMSFTNEGTLARGILRGCVFKQTYNQSLVRYHFSHLPRSILYQSYANYDDFSKFCLGSGNIIRTLSTLITEINPIVFSCLLYEIESYLQWESLEGGPFIKMEEIPKSPYVTKSPLSYDNLIEIAKEYMKKHDYLPIKFIDNGLISTIQFDFDEKFEELFYDLDITKKLIEKGLLDKCDEIRSNKLVKASGSFMFNDELIMCSVDDPIIGHNDDDSKLSTEQKISITETFNNIIEKMFIDTPSIKHEILKLCQK